MTALAGTARLTRLALRRDRFTLPAWSAVVAVLLAAMTLSMRDMYPTVDDRLLYASAMGQSTVQRLFNGPGRGLATEGGGVVFEVGGYLLVLVALLCILATVRHSRAQEAAGNTELVRATRVGVLAPDAAAVLAAGTAAVSFGTVAALVLGLLGLGWSGALAYGASMTATGLVFTALAAVACQLTPRSRTANLLASTVLVAAYLVRGFGDVNDSALVWASPLGWVQAVHPFDDQRWWPLILVLVLTLAALALALTLLRRRDLGAGILTPRRGRERRGLRLTSAARLTLRLTATTVLGWSAATLPLAVGFGAVTHEVAATEGLTSIGSGGVSEHTAMVRLCALVLAALAGAAGVALATVVAAEERSGRLDNSLAAGLSRTRWAACATGAVLTGSAAVLLVAAVGLVGGLRMVGADTPTAEALATTALHLPAVWVVAGIALALAAVRPGWTALGWLPVALVYILEMLGYMLQLPQWTLNLSPHSHVPAPSDLDDGVVALAVLLAVVAGLVAVSRAGLARRDLARAA